MQKFTNSQVSTNIFSLIIMFASEKGNPINLDYIYKCFLVKSNCGFDL